MRYLTLKAGDAQLILAKRRAGEEVDASEFLVLRGDGPPFALETVASLRASLEPLRAKYPAELRTRDPKGGDFEAEACSIVHDTLRLPPHVAGDPQFWVWLAIEHFSDLVEWRFNSPAAVKNYGIGAPVENLLFRLWMRGELGHVNGDGAYSLAQRGDQDFWRSHLLRQAYGRCWPVARALIRYQFPDGNPGKPTLGIKGVRELAKRLRLCRTNLLLESLSEDGAAWALITREARALRQEPEVQTT